MSGTLLMGFRDSLKAFVERQLTAPELISALDRALAIGTERGEHLRTLLEMFRAEQGLPLAVYEVLSTRLNRAMLRHEDTADATVLANFPSRQGAAPHQTHTDSAPTLLMKPIGHTASSVTRLGAPEVKIADIDTRLQEQLVPGMIVKGRFVLEEILGLGGMSVVFRARDLRKEEAQDNTPHIAIKVLGPDFKHHPDSLKVLQREAKKAQSLAHPNIVSVYDYDRDGHTIFMTMELLDGTGLDKVIQINRPGGLPLAAALPLIDGIAQALAYAHKKNIVHCDLKPANVYLSKSKVVKVLDFGIARALRDGESGAVEADIFDAGTLGALTPAYASCEMLEGIEPDPRDDIYAFSCITYELLTGRHPFNRKSAVEARAANMQPPVIPGLTRRQWAAMRQALSFRREARIADVLHFAAELRPRKFPRKRAIAATLATAAVLGGWIYYSAQNQQLADALEDALPRGAFATLTPEQQSKIRDLLEVGNLYLTLGQHAAPPGDNAFDAFQKVLEIDPLNAHARQGVTKIADYYESQARIVLTRQDYAQAKAMLELGLYVRPAHKGLLALQDELRDNP